MYFSSLFTGSYIIDGINFQNIKRGVGWLLTLRNNCRYLHAMSVLTKILHSFVLTLLVIIMRNNWFRSHLLLRKAKCVNDEVHLTQPQGISTKSKHCLQNVLPALDFVTKSIQRGRSHFWFIVFDAVYKQVN